MSENEPSWRERLLGGPRRLGFWTVPLFVAVGLAGAVLAGSLAAVYYAQEVDRLEEQTATARKELSSAVERVSEAAEEALGTIEREVNAVRDELAVTFPIEDPAAAGIVAVRAEVVVEPAQQPPPPQPGPGQTAPPQPPPAQPARTAIRQGSAFAVVVAEGSTFFVTSFAIVADPQQPGVPVESAEVLLGGQVLPVAVHSWDADRDLALLRADGVSRVPVPEWRPAEEAVSAGARLFAVGVLPTGESAQLGARVGAATDRAIVTDLSAPDVLRGGPLLDGQGRVVGVVSNAYRPFGGEPGDVALGVPIRDLCAGLIRCGANDLPGG